MCWLSKKYGLSLPTSIRQFELLLVREKRSHFFHSHHRDAVACQKRGRSPLPWFAWDKAFFFCSSALKAVNFNSMQIFYFDGRTRTSSLLAREYIILQVANFYIFIYIIGIWVYFAPISVFQVVLCKNSLSFIKCREPLRWPSKYYMLTVIKACLKHRTERKY